MNNKSQISQFWLIMGVIATFSIIIFFFLFFSVGLKQIIGENLITPVINSSLNATSDMISTETVNQVNTMKSMWDTDFMNFDLYFILIFLIFVIELFYSASKISIDNMYNFFGLITVGNLLFLAILTFIGQIRDWLILNLYTNLFDLTLVNTPIIDIFISNANIISFILFLICILIATLDWQQVKEKAIGFSSQEVKQE